MAKWILSLDKKKKKEKRKGHGRINNRKNDNKNLHSMFFNKRSKRREKIYKCSNCGLVTGEIELTKKYAKKQLSNRYKQPEIYL